MTTDLTLVAYATRYGSTQEVAEAVATRLRQRGVNVEVKPAKEVTSLAGCRGVVLGTPFYVGSMLKDASRFLTLHRAALEKMPVALFALGPTTEDADAEAAHKQLESAVAKMPWLRLATAEMFVGKYEPAKLRLADKLLAALPASPLHGLGAHDDRDWEVIKAWADKLPAALGLDMVGRSS